MQLIQSIQNRIYEVRQERIMLDFDLADLYEVEGRVLNQAVKRNIKRFPPDFMFQLTTAEWQAVSSQIVMMNAGLPDHGLGRFRLPKNRTGKYLPYAFTEQGVAMLSGILHSDKAINMNIAIMRAFVAIKRLTLQRMDWRQQLNEIKDRLGEHDAQLNQIYDALENLLDEKAAQRKWEDRERIGFNR